MGGLEVELRQDAPIPLAARLACAPGELLALVGPSGSGKTTILRAIAGLYRPRRGRVAVDGALWLDTEAAIDLPTRRRRVGLVFQSYALFPHLSALENLTAAMGHRPRAERAARARELLRLVHLDGLEDRRPAQLSGGQQQRVAVARALAREPAVLLLDEPFSAVDRATRQRLYLEIAELRRLLAMPVVLVTHDLEEAMLLADRLTVLHHGQTLQTGTPQEVTTRPASPQVARLVDIGNLFEGRIAGHDQNRGLALLDWRGLSLEVRGPPPAPIGTRVPWVIPDGFVILHRRDRPSRGEQENPVPGRIEQMLVLGQSARLTLRPDHAPELPLRFSVPLHVARRNGIEPGVAATVSLLAEGIHVMAPDGPVGAAASSLPAPAASTAAA
ncbi:MAG: ABC transporter ATP-binding protein [Geminicoccaceae bacterium]|nr:ABC transporter ATP-binding protein [Geminicoccaceae bacterium]